MRLDQLIDKVGRDAVDELLDWFIIAQKRPEPEWMLKWMKDTGLMGKFTKVCNVEYRRPSHYHTEPAHTLYVSNSKENKLWLTVFERELT
jgi:hypothetical protein